LPFQNFEIAIQDTKRENEKNASHGLIFAKQHDKLLPIELVIIGELVVDKIKRSPNYRKFD
jgi:hypothetical protein